MTTRPYYGNFLFGGDDYAAPGTKTREERLEYEVKTLRQRFDDLQDSPNVFGIIISAEEKRVTVNTGPQVLSLKKPVLMKGLEPGATVRLVPGQGGGAPAILGVVDAPPVMGRVVKVKQVIDQHHVEVDTQGQPKVALTTSEHKIKAGDRVVLDFTDNVVVRNLGKADKAQVYSEPTGVTWDDIGGLEEAKAALVEAIEEPVLLKDLYKRYGRKPAKGVLLYGPPGTGKTLLGKACATALARVHGASARAGGFLYVKGPEMLDKFVGNSESNIRALFGAAREHFAREGYPAVIFVDEADAIMGKRGASRGIEGMERTIVPQFLTEMDGLEDSGAMVLLATNRPDTLDPAIIRDGRVDHKIYVRRPTMREAEHIFNIHLAAIPAASNTTSGTLAAQAAAELFDDRHALYMIRTKDGKDQRFGLGNLASGALIATLAQKAAQRAIRRDRAAWARSADASGRTRQDLIGITRQDLIDCIRDAVGEARVGDHIAEVTDFIEERKLDAVKVERAS